MGCDHGGPCEATVEDALFDIRSARNAETDAPISQLLLTEFLIEGEAPAEVAFLLGEHARNVMVSEEGLGILCTVPCAFGNVAGIYTFSVVAEGFQTQRASYDATYAEVETGCPSSADQGLELDVRLTPEAS